MYYNPDWRQYYGPMAPVYGGMYGYPAGMGYPMMAGMPYGYMPPVAREVLRRIQPVVRYAVYEQQVEKAGLGHTIREVAAIAYLMGRGYPFAQARQIVESWEIDEKFPGFEP